MSNLEKIMKNLLILSFFILLLSSCTWSNNVDLKSKDSATQIIDINYEDIKEEEKVSMYQKFDFLTGSWELVEISPVDHATAILEWNDMTVFVDPANLIDWYKSPDIILVTHEHWDHFNNETLKKLLNEGTVFITTEKVYSQLNEDLKQYTTIMKNWEDIEVNWFKITAIAAYNLREEALNFHPKGQGNGYIIERDNFRVYFSGDSEDIPEMRALENIDIAFVSMNLPYTMPVWSAADAVLEFAPKNVFPYHYRGKEEISDINKFKELVEEQNSEINVIFWNWYE